ncbi:uncharacterized protein LOC143447387 [Clavelina lepadiformis]|uniref:uncharacterized protein LOC143447387 n=1 Tax=Clavelina lepadiformis TaxID=159417 RepID=UPI0040423C89
MKKLTFIFTAFVWIWKLRFAETLTCNGGIQLTVHDKLIRRDINPQPCPNEKQSCLTADAAVAVKGMTANVYVGSCAYNCKEEAAKGCQETLEDLQISSSDITRCRVSCCNSSDFCNIEPQPSASQKPSAVGGGRRCYVGIKKVLSDETVAADTIKEKTCGQDYGPKPSCISATLTMNRGTKESIGLTTLKQCYPAKTCDRYICDLMLQEISDNVRGMVTSCETSCCTGDLCNDAAHTSPRALAILTFLFVALTMSLIAYS